MRLISIAAAGVSLILIALTLAPATGEFRAYFAAGALVCAAIVMVTVVTGWREKPIVPTAGGRDDGASMTSVRANSVQSGAAGAPPLKIVPPPPKPVSSEAEVVAFLAVLQEKGRFVDFLQDDITAYSDAQVGAAARVVHQGCKAVLGEYFRIVPVRAENEGARVLVPDGYDADEYRLAGKISGPAPFSGTLVHRGWKAEAVSLPRVLRAADDRLPTIAPAEVELR